jgi:hypothetical protein
VRDSWMDNRKGMCVYGLGNRWQQIGVRKELNSSRQIES